MDDQKKCPICGGAANVGNRELVDVKCSRCGNFKITDSAKTVISSKDKRLLTALSAYTRQASERGETVELSSRNWEEFARAHLGTLFSQKISKLLDLFCYQL